MSEPSKTNSIIDMLARPPETLTPADIKAFRSTVLAGAVMMEECSFYQEVLGWDDVHAAHAAILARADDLDYMFDNVRTAVLQALVRKMEKREAKAREEAGLEVRDIYAEFAQEVASTIEVDRAREAAFRRDPGEFLAGASNSMVRLFDPAGCWVIEREGYEHPWLVTHAALRYAQSDLLDVYERACRSGRFDVLVVGAPGLCDRVTMPGDVDFTEIQVEVLEIDLSGLTGPAGNNGGRAA